MRTALLEQSSNINSKREHWICADNLANIGTYFSGANNTHKTYLKKVNLHADVIQDEDSVWNVIFYTTKDLTRKIQSSYGTTIKEKRTLYYKIMIPLIMNNVQNLLLVCLPKSNCFSINGVFQDYSSICYKDSRYSNYSILYDYDVSF